MPRRITTSSPAIGAALLCLFAVTACDSTDPRDDDLTDTEVFAVELSYDLWDAEVVTGDYGTGVANLGYDMPEIGGSVVRDGAVLVYIEDELDTWKAVPFTVGIEKIDEPVVDYTYTLNYAYDIGFIDVFVRASTDDPVVWDEIRNTRLFVEPRTLKVVIIDEFFASRAQSAGVDLQSYSEVKAHFGLEE